MPGLGGQNKAKGMEMIITKPGQSPVAHFVSGLDEYEKKIVVWEIQNVVELLGMPLMKALENENGITFDAGHSIGIPATWGFHLFKVQSDPHILIGLKLSPNSKAKVVKASCSISLLCGSETIASADLLTQEFKYPPVTDSIGGFAYLRSLARYPLTESDIIRKTDNGRKALKVTLTLKVFSSKESVESPKTGFLKDETVISDFQTLLETEDGADVEISVPLKVGGELGEAVCIKKVHKGILMGRSSVFAKMFAKESEMVETKTGKVVIKDLSPKGLGIFLHYIYTGKVLDEWVKVPEEILNASEKYDLGRLKNYCAHNIMSAVTTTNALEMYQLAKLHKLSFAKSAVAEFISKNTEAVLDVGDDDN